MRNDLSDTLENRDFRWQLSSQSEMQRSLFQQAVRLHGRDLSILTEKHQQGNFVFIEKENEEQQQLADHEAEESDHRESSANDPDTTAVAPYQDGAHLTGTMRDLVRVQSRRTADSSTEESSKSDTSPEILPLGVPRELHEPFQELPPKLLKSNGFVSKLHNFISKKADLLFKATPADKEPATLPSVQDTVDLDYYATLPPFEQFMVVPPDQSRKRLFDILAIGDIIAGSIVAIKDFGMFVQVVCLFGKEARYLQECDIVGLLPKGDLGDRFSLKAQLEDFRAGDMVRCRVVKTDAANEKVILTMINLGEQNEDKLLGIINESELPVHYRRSQTQRETQESYDEMLDNTLGFDNSYNVSCLANMLNIDDADPPSLIPDLQSSNFSTEEHAEALRKWQSHKWAMESVARGVEHFKASRYLEAMQQLNRALEIDAENVEGLVARGALFANQNNLSKAIKDFAEALRIRPSHKNANRYMCQTLYEKGKQCEENGEKEKARDCYQSAIDLTPDFQDALVSLQRLQKPSRRKSVREESEEVWVESSSEESPQEQMSAKQLREMISEEKSSTKKKKKKDKHSKSYEDGKGDSKVKKELKMGKKKKKKNLRKRSSSPEVISKQKRKEPSSNSESESSEPPSPVPKHKDNKKGSKGDSLKEPQSPEEGRPTGRKRSRNGSLSSKRKSRSKTRKADLIRKKSKHASGTSSSDDDKLNKVEPKKDKRNHSKSLERSDSLKAKHKGDKNRSRKESESSSFVSSSEEEQLKKTKKESKKEGKDRRVKEEVSHKKRKMKTKKEKVKRSRSSSSVFEESADSLSYTPMRKKSKSAKKVKKKHKKSKKRSESVSSLSASGSDSERKPSPPRKVLKKKKMNKKKKPKKNERSTSVSSPSVPSSESPERQKSPEEPAKKMKHMKKTKEEDHYSDGSSSDISSSSMQQKISKEKRDVKTRITEESPARSDRRSRSASLVKKERAPNGSSDEGEVKIGKKRSRSNEYSIPKVKDHPKKQSAKEAVHTPPNERQRRKTSDVPSDESEDEHTKKKDGRTGRKQLESPEEDERPQSAKKEKTRNKEKVDRKEEEERSSRRSKRHSRAQSPDDHRKERSASRERNKPDDRDKKKSRKSRSPASLSPHRKETSEDSKQGKLAKQSEHSGERSISREKNKADEKDKKKQRRSNSSASESPPKRGSAEDRKQEKSDKHSKTREESPEKLSKSSRRSRSLSPRTKKEEEKEQRTPIRERKRKRSGSFIAESSSLETTRRDRKSRDSENGEEKLSHKKESGGVTRNRHDSSQESSHRSKSADSGKDRRKESPKESKKSHSKRSPSPPERKNERRRSREEANQSRYLRSSRSTSADYDERKQRSKSGSYDRDKDKEHDRRSEDKDRDGNRRESKEGSRRKSGSLDRESHTQERRLSDGDRHKNYEDSRQKSSERERPRSREEERKKEKRDTERRTSHEAKKDDRDRGRDRSKEGQYYDHERPGRGKSRERERSKERDRRDSGKTADSSRERRDKSRENEKAGSRSESSRGDKKFHTDSSKENGKGGTKGQESQHHQSLKVAPTLNVEDIPMPPENAPVVEAKKEPSPILYVTSSSCKDEIIKVKSKWDTDSEDDESGPSGPSQNRRGGGGRGSTGSQRSYIPSSQYSGSNGSGNGSGGQNYGGYHRCEGGNCLDNTSSSSNSLETPQSCLHMPVLAEQLSYHEPLRLRGGCVASPPPKYESDYSDSDESFSSSSSVDSEESRRDSLHERQLRVGRRQKSSSSDRSSGERSKKRFKQSSGRESRSSSSSSIASSSGSRSSRSSSRSDISYSSRSHSRSPSSSRSSSSLSHRSYSSNSKSSRSRDSSTELQKTQTHDEESSTERSDSEGAGAYNLFDSWETYMDSKGHNLGNQVPPSNRNQRTVKLEAGGSTVGKQSRRPDPPFVEPSSEEDQENFGKTDGYSLDKNNENKIHVSKTAQIERLDGDNVSVDKVEFDGSGLGVTGNERKSKKDAAQNQQSRSLEDAQSSKSHTSLVVEEVTYEKHSKKRDGDKPVTRPKMESSRAREYVDSSARRYSQEHGHGHSGESYRHDRSSAGRYSSEYGNQLNVGHSHTYTYTQQYVDRGYQTGDQQVRDHRRDRYKDERHYRSDRSYGDDRNHSRHTYPQQEERRDYHRRSERGFESHRYGRREHSFRKRRDNDDWGRGVTEVQERGTFFGLVTKSKEELVSQLYSVCSTTLELIRSEHREWWL